MAAPLPNLSLHDGVKANELDAPKIVNEWLSKFEKHFQDRSLSDASGLFLEDCWWRDIIALSWDWATKHGQESVFKYLKASSTGFRQLESVKSGGLQPAFVDMGGLQWIQSGFNFKTSAGHGTGLVRLANVGPSDWRAWTVLTELEQLNGQEELERQKNDKTLTDARFYEAHNGDPTPISEDLQVLIVGAGQAGVALGAHLKNMGIRTLLVDKLPRVGDSWRQRYETVTSHTPTYTDHYPFLKFPENWPTWLPREKVAGWMENYSQIMGLDIMVNTTVSSINYDEAKRQYSVELQSDNGKQTLNPRHVVLAAGLFSPVPIRPNFPSEKSFKGQVYHTSEHKAARRISNVKEKKVILIGSGTSSHDIAQDFVNSGAKEVTIVQRGAIFSVSTSAIEQTIYSLWKMPGMSTEEADVVANSFPLPIIRTMGIGQSQMMSQMDKEILDGMEKAGLALRRGDDGAGIVDHQLLKGGHFYIDQGAQQMIVDGRIKIVRCKEGVKDFYENGIVLADGKRVEADVVILATGFNRNILTVEQLMGKEVVKKVGDLGHIDEDFERIGWWRPTGYPGFWYMTGSFIWTRQYSQVLALQISAIEQGLNPDYYTAPDTRSRVNIYPD